MSINHLNFNGICVGVLAGGISGEREISLLSGEQVFLSLKRQGINTQFIDITSSNEKNIKGLIYDKGIDVVFIALHGEFGEDGAIQTILEETGIPYTGSKPIASYSAMDKIVSKNKFLESDISTPNFFILKKSDVFYGNCIYPLVIKPYFGGSSLGVSIARNNEELKNAVEKVFSLTDKAILEDYIEGREFTVGILGNRPLGVVEIIPKAQYFDFSNKYTGGLAQFFAPASLKNNLRLKIRQLALSAHDSLGCEHFSRVDLVLSKNDLPFVLEVNSIPGLTSHSLLPLSAKCCGIDFDSLIKKMLTLAMLRGEENKESAVIEGLPLPEKNVHI